MYKKYKILSALFLVLGLIAFLLIFIFFEQLKNKILFLTLVLTASSIAVAISSAVLLYLNKLKRISNRRTEK